MNPEKFSMPAPQDGNERALSEEKVDRLQELRRAKEKDKQADKTPLVDKAIEETKKIPLWQRALGEKVHATGLRNELMNLQDKADAEISSVWDEARQENVEFDKRKEAEQLEEERATDEARSKHEGEKERLMDSAATKGRIDTAKNFFVDKAIGTFKRFKNLRRETIFPVECSWKLAVDGIRGSLFSPEDRNSLRERADLSDFSSRAQALAKHSESVTPELMQTERKAQEVYRDNRNWMTPAEFREALQAESAILKMGSGTKINKEDYPTLEKLAETIIQRKMGVAKEYIKECSDKKDAPVWLKYRTKTPAENLKHWQKGMSENEGRKMSEDEVIKQWLRLGTRHPFTEDLNRYIARKEEGIALNDDSKLAGEKLIARDLELQMAFIQELHK